METDTHNANTDFHKQCYVLCSV